MIDSLVNLLFRCRHRRLSRPMSPLRPPGAPPGEIFAVCLDCGKRFSYDWAEMRFTRAKESCEEPVRAPEMQ